MIFIDDKHEILFNTIGGRMRKQDCYHLAMAYLLALDSELRKHYTEVFDFDADGIKINALNKGWQTGTSAKTTRLALNLWNGYCYEENGLPSKNYTPAEIFNSKYAPYYWQAVKIRFYL